VRCSRIKTIVKLRNFLANKKDPPSNWHLFCVKLGLEGTHAGGKGGSLGHCCVVNDDGSLCCHGVDAGARFRDMEKNVLWGNIKTTPSSSFELGSNLKTPVLYCMLTFLDESVGDCIPDYCTVDSRLPRQYDTIMLVLSTSITSKPLR
jgi:hypothetical protein